MPIGRTAVTLLAGALAFLPSSLLASSARADSLVFEDTRPIALTWDQATHGIEVRVCNVGAQAVLEPRASLIGFGFVRNGHALSDDRVWLDPEAPKALAAGTCGDLLVQTKDFDDVDGGAYAGRLVVLAAGAGRVERAITVTRQEAEPVTAVAGDSVSMTAKRPWPWASASLDDDGRLPLKGAPDGKELGEPKTPLGLVSKGVDVGSVYAAGATEPVPGKGYGVLPIEVEGIDHVGDYSGTLNLAKSGAKEQPVKLAISVTDAWWCPLIVVVLGALASWLGQLWLRRCRVRRKLYKRLGALYAAYAEAADDFHILRPDSERIEGPSDDAIAKYVQDVVDAIDVDMRSSMYFDASSDAYKAIVEAIEQAEDDARFLGSEEGLSRRLVALRRALAELPAFPARREPALVAAAKAVESKGELAVGEALARGKLAGEYVGLIGTFKALMQRLALLEQWAQRLRAHARANPGAWTDADLELLAEGSSKIAEAEHGLFYATDAADLERLDADHDLGAAHGALAVVGDRHDVPLEPEEEEEDEDEPQVRTLGFHAQAVERRGGAGLDAGDPLGFARSLKVRAARAPLLGKTLGMLADWLTLGLAAAATIVAALVAVYFGKSWGTTGDYLALFFGATTAQALATTLSDTVSKMALGTRTSRLLAAPRPAVAKAEATPDA